MDREAKFVLIGCIIVFLLCFFSPVSPVSFYLGNNYCTGDIKEENILYEYRRLKVVGVKFNGMSCVVSDNNSSTSVSCQKDVERAEVFHRSAENRR